MRNGVGQVTPTKTRRYKDCYRVGILDHRNYKPVTDAVKCKEKFPLM